MPWEQVVLDKMTKISMNNNEITDGVGDDLAGHLGQVGVDDRRDEGLDHLIEHADRELVHHGELKWPVLLAGLVPLVGAAG